MFARLPYKFLPFQFMVHEIGHNLGMGHDFLDGFDGGGQRFSAAGLPCTDIGGHMDYTDYSDK